MQRLKALSALPCALFMLLGLAGCGATQDAGSILIDPGRYSVYHCDDLAARWKVLVGREKDLRALMEKANQTPSGAIIGSLSYRTDYESVLSEERLLQRTAAEKNCNFSTRFQSDQIIH
jgi:hypothetical protein